MTSSRVNFEPLQKGLNGEVITPQDPAYDEARKVYNAMIDRKPAAIARCADQSDIHTCIQFAHNEGLRVAVRGGGHNAGGLGVADDALVIDLSPMNSVTVDMANKTVTSAEGHLGEVDAAAGLHGLTSLRNHRVDGCRRPDTGWWDRLPGRQAGLSIDNLISAIMLADGTQVRRARPTTRTFLGNSRGRWKLRRRQQVRVQGAVSRECPSRTSALPIERHWRGVAVVPEDTAVATARHKRMVRRPDDSASSALPRRALGCKGVRHRVVHHAAGKGRRGRDGAASLLRDAAPRWADGDADVCAQHRLRRAVPPGLQWYWRADFVGEISDDAIRVHEKYGELLPTGGSTMHLYPIDGAVHDASESDTAFAYRDAGWAAVIVGVDPEPATASALRDWAVAYQEELHPTALQGAYINFIMDEGQGRVKASYGPNFDRLQTSRRSTTRRTSSRSTRTFPLPASRSASCWQEAEMDLSFDVRR